MSEPLVDAKDLTVHYPLFKGFLRRLLGGGGLYVHAVDGISFEVRPGEIFGLVGESGCGKSTTGRALLALAPVVAGRLVIKFADRETNTHSPRRVRPRGLGLFCAVWWATAALSLVNGFLALYSGPLLPAGVLASSPVALATSWITLGVLEILLGAALWTMQPWSRRPARVVAACGSLLALIAVPLGILPLVAQLTIFVYLGSADVAAILRRSGWVRPVSGFVIGPGGVLEIHEEEGTPTTWKRWLVGPRAGPASSNSWLLRQLRSKVQIVYQDPHAALNPALTLGEALQHVLLAHWDSVMAAEGWPGGKESVPPATREALAERARQLLEDVGLRPAEQFLGKFPSELSGGQKQRVVIARALAPRPQLLVADEPVALLDMSIRARILELLLDLKQKYGLTYVFITHDLATAKLICDRIAIMYLGRIVEMGASSDVYAAPKHPYTQALLQAIPIPDPKKRHAKVLPKGEVPDAVHPPAGCRFHPRCPVALPTCGWEGRDFLDYLEERRLDPESAKIEEEVLGRLESWWVEGLQVGRKVSGEDPERLLGSIRAAIAEAPSPLAKAVEDVSAREGSVVIRFRPPDLLIPKEVSGQMVECLLY